MAHRANADGTGHYFQQLRQVGSSSNTYTFRSCVVTMNIERSRRVPADEALPDGSYRWRMRSESAVSGVPDSSYASWCYFRIDTTPPPEPEAVLLTADPTPGGAADVRLLGSGDTHRFRYSLNSGSTTTVSSSGGIRTITVQLPEHTIDNHLQVWALDEAGNVSARHDLFFTAGRTMRPPLAALWRFDGDWFDDAGYGNHLTAGASVTFADDRRGRATSAAQFDGQSCAVADGPILRTDEAFTIAAWVRPTDQGSRPANIVAQAGENASALRLRR